MSTFDPEPLWDIVEEHLDEAEFLWGKWEHSLVAPHYTLAEVVAGPEARLLAHIDALVVNGPKVAERLLVPTLHDQGGEPTRIRAAALSLLNSPGDGGIDTVLTTFISQPALRPELARALECADPGPVLPRLQQQLDTRDDDLFSYLARVLTFHGASLTAVLPRLLASERIEDRSLAVRLLPRAPADRQQMRTLLKCLHSDDPGLRDEALACAALLDLPQAWTCARELADASDPSAGRALLLLALRADPADLPVLLASPAIEALRAAALWALGFLGTAAAIEAALPWLADEALGKLAGEVVTAVTGLDLERERLTRAAPSVEALEHRPEDNLPCPDPEGVTRWWQRSRGNFKGGQRFIAGRKSDTLAVLHALRDGPMRRRAPYLFLLQRQAPRSRPFVELSAPGRRQRRELALLSG